MLAGVRETLGGLRGKQGSLWLYRARTPSETTHSHAELEFNLVVRGRVDYLVDGRRYELARGSLLWLFPRHEHLLVGCSPDTEMWIGVLRPAALAGCSPSLTRELGSELPPGPVCRRLAPAVAFRLGRLCGDLEPMRAPPDQPDRDGFRTGLVHVFAASWEAFAAAGDAGERGRDLHPAVAEAMRMLDAGDARPLATVARAVGLERSVLSRHFRRDVGTTLADYRCRCRLERFIDLAAGHRRTFLEAALAAGFGSYAQFHRVFRRVMGASPRTVVAGRVAG